MLAHIDEFRLLDSLFDLNFSGGLDGEGLYDLVLAATGDEQKASRMRAERYLARSRAGL